MCGLIQAVLLLTIPVPLESDLPTRFKAEYADALTKIESQFSDVHFTANIDNHGRAVEDTDYACKGKAFRVISYTITCPRADQVGMEHVYVATQHDKTYYLRKFPQTDQYVVSAEDIDYEFMISSFRPQLLPAFAPFCIHRQRVADLMAEDDFEATSVRQVKLENEIGVRVDWRSLEMDPNVGRVRKSGWFTVLPSRDWVLKEYEIGFARGDEPFTSWNRVLVTYDELGDGFPIVTGVKYWMEKGEERSRVPVASYRDVVMSRIPLPDEEFTLRKFGLSEPARPRPELRHTVSVDKNEFDVGTITAADEVTRQFTVKNHTTEEVQLLGAHCSCGCAIGDDLPLKLAPNEERVLTLAIRVSEGWSGRAFATGAILYTDIRDAQVVIRVKGRVSSAK